MSDQTAIRERAARRGLFVTLAIFAVPLVLALTVMFWAMRDNAALFAAAKTNDVKAAERILDQHPERLERRDRSTQTPLHVAAWAGSADVLALLLRRGADPNAKWDSVATNDGQWSALHIVAVKGNVRMAEILIGGGTDINGKSLGGETPLDVAVRNSHQELANLLRAHGGVSGKNR